MPMADLSSDLSETLPALRDGSEWIGGFQNIVNHLSERPDRHWDLDAADLSLTDKADITGYVLPHIQRANSQVNPDFPLAFRPSSKPTVNPSLTSVSSSQARTIP